MRQRRKSNKHGGTTMFLAIVLSAVILIECTYLTFVWDMDRRMEISRALKCEVEAILADYDRELFKMYGIYAFTLDDTDDYVFNKVLEARGLEAGQSIEIDGVELLDTEAIRSAISSYYAYRGAGVLFKMTVFQVKDLIEKVDKTGLIGKIREFMSSGASSYLADILSGSFELPEGFDELSEEDLEKIRSISTLIEDSEDDVNSYDGSIRITDLGFIADGFSDLEQLINLGSGLMSLGSGHQMIAHYAAYNFDCAVDNEVDCSITGVPFSEIHSDNMLDSEYISNGVDGHIGLISVSSLIFQVLFCKAFLDIYSNPAELYLYQTIALVAATIIPIISGGTIEIPTKAMEFVVIAIACVCKACSGYSSLMNGETVSLYEEDEQEFIKLSYRDFLYIYQCCVPDSELLKRMDQVLVRDFGDLCIGVTLATDYRETRYDISKCYSLY